MQDYHSFLSTDKHGGFGLEMLRKAPRGFTLRRMILRPKPSARDHGSLLTASSVTEPLTPMPDWLRSGVLHAQPAVPQGLPPNSLEDVAVVAGAAIGALDLVVRRQEVSGGAWREGLALSAAAVTARQLGRIEDESALRDAVLLTRPGDDVGPAGRLLLAWRRLVTRRATDLLTPKSVAGILEDFGYIRDDEMAGDLADDLRQLSAARGLAGLLSKVLEIADRQDLPRCVGAWLADALLAQRLGWMHAVPLLGTQPLKGHSRRHRSTAHVEHTEMDRARIFLVAQARGALHAVDLSTEYRRRADRLLAVAPRLRAKGAETVVGLLLSSDAISASERIASMSDRGLRRLFERLLDLGAVRELSGRSTFRIYGL